MATGSPQYAQLLSDSNRGIDTSTALVVDAGDILFTTEDMEHRVRFRQSHRRRVLCGGISTGRLCAGAYGGEINSTCIAGKKYLMM